MQVIESQDELYHYGILGMKWGIRRYQNSDGTLTEAGKKRARSAEKKAIKDDRKRASKDRSLLSDKELDTRIKRLEKEKRLRELTEQEVRRSKKYTDDILQNTGKQSVQKLVVEGAVAAIAGVGAAYLKSYLQSGSLASDIEWILR